MAASTVRIDGPAERHAGALGDAVQRGLGPDLVETGVERLGGVEVPHDRRLAVAGQRGALLGFDREVVPTHERMFAHRVDGTGGRGRSVRLCCSTRACTSRSRTSRGRRGRSRRRSARSRATRTTRCAPRTGGRGIRSTATARRPTPCTASTSAPRGCCSRSSGSPRPGSTSRPTTTRAWPTEALESYRRRPEFGGPAPSMWMGESGIALVAWLLSPTDALADRLAELVVVDRDHDTLELMWGSPGLLLVADAMLERTGEERWTTAWGAIAEHLLDRWGDGPPRTLDPTALRSGPERTSAPRTGSPGSSPHWRAAPSSCRPSGSRPTPPRPSRRPPSAKATSRTGRRRSATRSRIRAASASSGATARRAWSPRWRPSPARTSSTRCSSPAVS